MFCAKTTIILALLAVQTSAHVGYTQSPKEVAETFDKTATTLCNEQPMSCIEPLLHKDFELVTASETLNRAQYVEFLKTQTANKVNDFKVDAANAKSAAGDQVDVPVLISGAIRLHAFLVADDSVQGGIALIKIDKKNV